MTPASTIERPQRSMMMVATAGGLVKILRDRLTHRHRRPHPRMDAALVLVRPFRFGVRLARTARRNELDVGKIQALWRGSRIAGQVVQLGDEAAAEVVHFRERMELASAVVRLYSLPFLQLDDAGGKVPRPHLL